MLPMNPGIKRHSVSLFYGIFSVILVRTAWLSDDSFITLRTVDNLVNGYGLTWNVAERVQAYTHPLWLLVLLPFYFVTREPYYTTLAVSIGLSLLVLALVWYISSSSAAAIVAIAILTLSKSFTDYSTSGLENPLTHVLVVLFLISYLRSPLTPRRFFCMTLIAALGMVDRLDTALLYAPALLFAGVELVHNPERRSQVARLLALGLLPIVVWEGFALLYYGFPFPNTYYAKLALPLGRTETIVQGASYLLNSLSLDPLTLLITACGVLAALLSRSRRGWGLTVGILLYLTYVVWIGGDFMGGRFLTAPLLCAVVWFCRGSYFGHREHALLSLGAIALLGVMSPLSPLRSDHLYGTGATREDLFEDDKHITDERATFYQYTGLLTAAANRSMPHMMVWIDAAQSARKNKAAVISNPTVGMIGYFVGQDTFLIDELALGNALLARLPVAGIRPWRIGHLWRVTPLGYVQTIVDGTNLIGDPNLAGYYDALSLITRGPIFDVRRIDAIWKMNTGQYDYLIDREFYRTYAGQVALPAPDNSIEAGSSLETPGITDLSLGGIQVILPGVQTARVIDLTYYPNNEALQLEFYRGAQMIGRQIIPPSDDSTQAKNRILSGQHVAVPDGVAEQGYDKIGIVFPQMNWGGAYRLGQFRLIPGSP